jgi:hypothetical protein
MAEGALVLVIVLFGVALQIGLLVAVFSWHGARERQLRELFARLAAEYRLHLGADGITGTIRGVPVSLVREVRGSGKNKRVYTVARAQLVPGLDLGLSMRRARFGDGALEAMGLLAPDMLVGDPKLDAWMHVSAHEPERVRALLGPELRAALSRMDVYVEDHLVRAEQLGEPNEVFARWALDSVVWLAESLSRAASRVPPSPLAVPYLGAFEQAARALGLAWRATPAALGGVLDGVQVWAQLTRRGPQQMGLDLYAAHTRPLGLGLELRPARGSSFLFFGAPDVQLGDPAFDPRFDVHASSAALAAQVLDPEVRARIQALRDLGSIGVDDAGVRLTLYGAGDPRHVVPTLRAVRDLSVALVERASGHAGGHHGAYR